MTDQCKVLCDRMVTKLVGPGLQAPPGVIHAQVISSSQLSMNLSLAARNMSYRTVTVSSPCSASTDSNSGTATEVREIFVA